MTWEKLIRTLKTSKTAEEISSKSYEIVKWIPEVEEMFDFEQRSTYHQYDLWSHCVHTVLGIDKSIDDDMLYLAALLHDIGKIYSQTGPKNSEDLDYHYYGHPEKSAEMVEDIMRSLLLKGVAISWEDKERLLYYVRYHDDRVSLREKHLKRHLKMVDVETFKKLMALQVADANAHVISPIIQQRIDICSEWKNGRADEIKARLEKESQGNQDIYILTIESYEWTEIYGVFTDKAKLLNKYLYLLEHNWHASVCPKDLGLCIYAPKINEAYIESYYELCEGGLEWMGTYVPEISPVDIWGKEVEKKIEASLQIAKTKREKEKAWNELCNI